MNLTERVDQFRDKLFDLRDTVTRRFSEVAPRGSRGDHKEAIQRLERGRKCYNAHDYARAEEYFRQALLADERYPKAHYFLGLALYKQDDGKGAVRAWKRAIEIDPRDAMAAKAERKIRYVQNNVNRTINELKDRLGDK